MKQLIAGIGTCAILALPFTSHAQSADLRASLLLQIQSLLELIEELQEQVLSMNNDRSARNEDLAIAPLPPRPEVPSEPQTRTLSDYPAAGGTWADELVPGGGDVPDDGFRAYYFDTTEPAEVVATAKVEEIGINYAWADGPGFRIVSEDFGAFWIGYLDVAEGGDYTVNVAQSWSEARVVIDGRVVSKGQSEETLALDPGTYLVEVEFANNWHTTDFAVQILPEREQLTAAELRSELTSLTSGRHENWYVGAYESANNDRTVEVRMRESNDDVVLYLASYSQIRWEIEPNDSLAVVVVSAYESGSTITGVPDSVPILYTGYQTIESEYSLEVGCGSYRGSSFAHCENIDQLTRIDRDIDAVSGSPVDGFSGQYAMSETVVPEVFVTEAVREEYQDDYESAKAENAAQSDSQRLDNIF